MALAVLGTGAWGLRPVARDARVETAAVHVVVTDGTDARLWIERAGAPPRAMPLSCQTAPGPAALRVARRTADGAWRQDTVEMDLRAGQLHLVPVGGRPVCIDVHEGEAAPWRVPGSYPSPGVVTRADDGAAQPLRSDATLVAYPEDEDHLPARERVLVVANPFQHELRVTVTAPAWRLEATVPTFDSRAVPLGAADVEVTIARAADGALMAAGRAAPSAPPGRVLLHTVGGGTIYAWAGTSEATMPPLANGEWLELPAEINLRPRRPGDPAPWLLAARGAGDDEVGLVPLASVPVTVRAEARPVEARADVVVRELALPAALRDGAVAVAVSEDSKLWGVVDGVVHDLCTGRPLHTGAERVAHMAATPYGLVLVTRCGRLATMREGRLVLGVAVDPTVLLAPADDEAPSVWLYGAALVGSVTLQPLDGTPGSPQVRWIDGEAWTVEATAMAPAAGGGTLVANGRTIDLLRVSPESFGARSCENVLTLPEGTPDVIGVIDLDGRLLFATEECVYELRGDLVLPLAAGIGGPLVPWDGGLVVTDRRSGRLVHLSGPAFERGGAR